MEEALTVLEPAVEDRHRAPEATAEAADQLRGEGNLRDQHQRSASASEGVLGGAEVDLGLPAPGDSLEEEGLEPTLVQRPLQLRQRRGLGLGEALGPGLPQARQHRRGNRLLLDPHPAPLDQPLHRGPRPGHRAPQLVELCPAPHREEVAQRRGLGRRPSQRLRVGAGERHRAAHHLRPRLEGRAGGGHSRGQRGPEGLPERAPVVRGGELHQIEHVAGQRRGLLQHRRDRLQHPAWRGCRGRPEVEAQRPTPTEGHQEALAALQAAQELRRDEVGEGAADRTTDGHRGECGRRLLRGLRCLGHHVLASLRRAGRASSPADRRRGW